MFFDHDELDVNPLIAKKVVSLKRLSYPKKPRRVLLDQEICLLQLRSTVYFDVELYPNFFLVGFKHAETGAYFSVEWSARSLLNIEKLRYIMWRFRLVGFNSRGYDIHIIEAALKGASIQQLNELSDAIIFRGERPFQISQTFDHVDLIEVAPLRGSLKLYAARLHCQRMQELPISPHTLLSEEEADATCDYNFNDLDCTEILAIGLAEPLKMREGLSRKYGEDLRSKSDAQIAESVIGTEYRARFGHWPKKIKFENIDRTPRRYDPPSYIAFDTLLLQNAFQTIKDAEFEIDINGYVTIPPSIDGLGLNIANQRYRMSIGGLHSSETKAAYATNENDFLVDFDVSSYYPMIILNGGIYPSNMGPAFLDIYRAIVDRRIAAKKAKNAVEADGLKITTNGTFGKTGNPYSIMYSPELMLYITLTGQLLLLMLIEMATARGFEVVSANTDGIVFWCPRAREFELNSVVAMWEWRTKFVLEETKYAAYYARDVNNYIAVKYKFDVEKKIWTNVIDGCKTKGTYCDKGSALNSPLSKNPEMHICSYAVQEFLIKGISVETTIAECNDMRLFVSVRNVKGGAHKDGLYLGRVVRWYYGKGETGHISYVLSGNKVANTEGAVPLMEMDGSIPANLDREFYVKKAIAILYDVGYYRSPEQTFLLFG